jgi:hypothetical protein
MPVIESDMRSCLPIIDSRVIHSLTTMDVGQQGRVDGSIDNDEIAKLGYWRSEVENTTHSSNSSSDDSDSSNTMPPYFISLSSYNDAAAD